MEKRLIDSEEKFHKIYELSLYGIILLNFKGTISDCNYRTLELFEYNKKEFVEKSYLELQAFPIKSQLVLKNKFGEIQKGQKIEPFEIQIFTKNGRSKWLCTIAILVQLQDQIIIQLIFQDISKYGRYNSIPYNSN